MVGLLLLAFAAAAVTALPFNLQAIDSNNNNNNNSPVTSISTAAAVPITTNELPAALGPTHPLHHPAPSLPLSVHPSSRRDVGPPRPLGKGRPFNRPNFLDRVKNIASHFKDHMHTVPDYVDAHKLHYKTWLTIHGNGDGDPNADDKTFLEEEAKHKAEVDAKWKDPNMEKLKAEWDERNAAKKIAKEEVKKEWDEAREKAREEIRREKEEKKRKKKEGNGKLKKVFGG